MRSRGIPILVCATRRREPRDGVVVASQGVILTTAAALSLALQRAAAAGSARTVLLQPGSRLPPNEIFGSEFLLGMIAGPLLLVGVLAIPGLVLSVLLMVADRRARHRPT